MGKKLTIDFIKKSFLKENYILLDTIYTNSRTKLNYICVHGHQHSIIWSSWQTGRRCPTCYNEKIMPTFNFVKESFETEGYIFLDTVYTNIYTKLNYICPKGHKHNIRWYSWLRGNRCLTCHRNNITGQGHPNWKGGVHERQVPLYDTYHSQLSYCEEIRRSPNEPILLQVKCTKCESFFVPTLNQINSRIRALNNTNKGESHFYCSDECKHTCSIFRKSKYSADEKRSKINPNFTSAELQVWSQEVLKRADYICEYCSSKAEHAHHIQPKKLEPFFALDPANGIACCEACHYKYGHNSECSTRVLASIVC